MDDRSKRGRMRHRDGASRGGAPRDAWVAELYDRVGSGAWRLARRCVDDDQTAGELVARAFREFVDSGRRRDVELLQCVLDRVKELRATAWRDEAQRERRSSLDVRDAFELVYVGGARIADVATLLGCSTRELSRRMLDATRDPGLVPAT